MEVKTGNVSTVIILILEISRVVREDPKTPGLLFVGSETGIFISTNDGKNWQKIYGNFPVVPVYDMKINKMIL